VKQHTGKSTFPEAISLLFSPGVQIADNSLTNKEGFNGQLQNAVLCIIEEIDLSKSSIALNRIKNWVTAKFISIHIKGTTAYDDLNTTHWLQTANDITFCPAVIGDTRIGFIHVPNKPIYDPMFMTKLENEAPDFTRELLDVIIPKQMDRLRIPVIETSDKIEAMQRNQSPVLYFIEKNLFDAPGEYITLSEFFTRFNDWIDPSEKGYWTKQRISSQMPGKYIKGRISTGTWAFGNLSAIKPSNLDNSPYILINDRLKIEGDK